MSAEPQDEPSAPFLIMTQPGGVPLNVESAAEPDDAWNAFYDAIYRPETEQAKAPYGSLQWKGTDACMDIHCVCGAHSHIDGEFAYYFKCYACGRRFALGSIVSLIPLTDEQAEYAATRHAFFTDQTAEPE